MTAMMKAFTKISGLLGRPARKLHISPAHIFGCMFGRNIQLAVSGYNFTDYEQERKSFSLQQPEYFNFAVDFIDQWAHAEQVGLSILN